MNDEMPVYWILFHKNPSALNALHQYQKKHYGTGIDKPPQPKQKPLEIPVTEDDVEEITSLMSLPPRMQRGYGDE